MIVAGMSRLAQITDQAMEAIKDRHWEALAKLMSGNFSIRREMYGDAALGTENLKMISLAEDFGAAVKFPGSGGAVIGLLDDPKSLVICFFMTSKLIHLKFDEFESGEQKPLQFIFFRTN